TALTPSGCGCRTPSGCGCRTRITLPPRCRMDKVQDEALADTLERWIGRFGLRAVVGALLAICHGKADHVRTNWPEEKGLPRLWGEAGDRIERTRFFLPRLP